MESKNVKVIDEHGIDREANVICKFVNNGNDYVLYSIERDDDNDNLFVSKLVNNNDGTSNMVNIEDSSEKAKINELAKSLVTYSIKNENDVASSVVELPDGDRVDVSSVLFNKDQNINVSKTYVTTVKKAVTNVSEKFYQVENMKEGVETVVEAIPEMPEVEAVSIPEERVLDNEPTDEEIMNSFVEPPVEEVKVEEAPVLEEPKEEVKTETPEIIPEEKVEMVKEEPMAVVNEEVILPAPEVKTEETSVLATDSEPVAIEEVKSEPEPIIPTVSAVPVQATEPVEVLPEPSLPVPEETPELVFDASKEENLKIALGEVTSDTSVKVDDAESFREFGQETPALETPTEVAEFAETSAVEQAGPVKTLKRSKGFANSKFITVVAILFFVASCLFLGYEIFNYFQLTK